MTAMQMATAAPQDHRAGTPAAGPIALGCIADDFTGATDLANNLVRTGFRVTQINGLPTSPLNTPADAVVVALKSRTIAAQEAVSQSLEALAWLRAAGAQQIYFKYCSTFDSTPAGNIGPVAEALMAALETDFTIATPAFPDNGRTVFKGHLFVGDQLLHESGMAHHPLTPMTDSNLVRVLQAQCKAVVGLVDHRTVAQGAKAIEDRIQALKAEGVRLAVVDAVSNEDLIRLGPALKGLPLITAGSGVAIGLAPNHALAHAHQAASLPPTQGRAVVLSGSCSVASNQQVAHFQSTGQPSLAIDVPRALAGAPVAQEALAWAQNALATTHGPILIYSTSSPDAVKAHQSKTGAMAVGEALESVMAQIAAGLPALGVGQLVVAGGETSGACVQALGLHQLQIGPQIDPGVPWCHANGLHIALKSGNFGSTDFFTKAFTQLT
jgi:3-dehydrotetronate 4-kinase